MWTIVFVVLTILCGFKWMQWKLATHAWAWYLEKRGYQPPNDHDIKECTRAVIGSLLFR
ncbi:hypothetical protein [Blautia marasmi]|uniref:hypothetical protein n=1 Tax=Blautia marasmi TaxID=1917868 RepID=UPI00131A2095|nr:hypothetical protein [Blautia marasmi]